MKRRAVVLGSSLLVSPLALLGCSRSPVQTFATVPEALTAIEALGSGWRSTGAWDLGKMLHHVAQSVEFSLQGFPEMKSSTYRSTVGAAAFWVFDTRGAMSHSLSEPIPGAAPLAAGAALDAAIARALQALQTFDSHRGPLMPHFAYGALDKQQYTRAHLMHLANHWTEVSKA